MKPRIRSAFARSFTSSCLEWQALDDMYFSAYAPWKLSKIRERQQKLAGYPLHRSRIHPHHHGPALPHPPPRHSQSLGAARPRRHRTSRQERTTNNLAWGGLQPGTKLGPLAPIFPRADKGLAQIMIDTEETRATTAQVTQSSTTSPLVAEQDPTSRPRRRVPPKPTPSPQPHSP